MPEIRDKCFHHGFTCANCGYVDYLVMYASDPPQYKCEKYGCLVRTTDKCKGEKKNESDRKG